MAHTGEISREVVWSGRLQVMMSAGPVVRLCHHGCRRELMSRLPVLCAVRKVRLLRLSVSFQPLRNDWVRKEFEICVT